MAQMFCLLFLGLQWLLVRPPLNEREFHLGDGSSNVPIILDFSGTVPNLANTRRPTRPGVARVVRTRSRAHAGQSRNVATNRSSTHTPVGSSQHQGQPSGTHANSSPMQGPIALPQREDHEVRNRLSHFHPNERQTLREDIVKGLIDFLDENNALVHLFRTAREKLREADIPNFNIRLFGVVGATQYELPTADSIGAIVFEGGPETLTDYDVVIERHSREPESVNKLHPQYMALQFPLLFIYGEEGYHLKLRLKNSDPLDTQDEKKMTMKIYYAYQLSMALTGETSAPSKTVAEPPVPQRSFAYFTDLNPADNTKFIEARVYRKWIAMKVPSFIATRFSCILLDKKVIYNQYILMTY
ncbi:helitron helicase-like domain-containing protein [Artemisia annua]|uniref:Helitron helicase-like domain-containing protein n=1 Tax=Artemisia annua TaxID=35608 RepID=A0A2U1MTY2_ARTAN|nr:helitron helicase-like domain-containing protein [Artemisia annua]